LRSWYVPVVSSLLFHKIVKNIRTADFYAYPSLFKGSPLLGLGTHSLVFFPPVSLLSF